MRSDQFHLDREVVSTWRVSEKASIYSGGPWRRHYRQRRTQVKMLKVLEQGLTFLTFQESNLTSVWRLEASINLKVEAGRGLLV